MNTNKTKTISWIEGSWVLNNNITLPINDRSLTLGDGIFETILIRHNRPQLLTEHLNRWEQAASQLRIKYHSAKTITVKF